MALRGERKDKATYEILRTLTGGSVAEVHEVFHKVLGCRCIQKTYSTVGLTDAVACQEPRLLREIQHPNVVQVFEAQWDPEDHHAITFVALFYEGGSIADALLDGFRFSVHHSLRIIRQTLDALAFVHTDPSLRYIHRDVKPSNVLLNASLDEAFLGDWGSAARREADGMVPGIHGTRLYMPPEAHRGQGRVGVTGDIYSAGLTLFELLNGRFRYEDVSPTMLDRRVSRGLRALPSSEFVFEPHVAVCVRRIVGKAIRSDPEGRFQSAYKFIEALDRVSGIDWLHEEGKGLDGQWVGTWPAVQPLARRRRFRVRSYVLRHGPSAGMRRLEAHQAVTIDRSFLRFGVPDATVRPDDASAVVRYFADVEASVAQR